MRFLQEITVLDSIVVLLTRAGERILKGSFPGRRFLRTSKTFPLYLFILIYYSKPEFQGGLCSKSEFLRLVWAVDRSAILVLLTF